MRRLTGWLLAATMLVLLLWLLLPGCTGGSGGNSGGQQQAQQREESLSVTLTPHRRENSKLGEDSDDTNAKIAFVRTDVNNYHGDLYQMNTDGSGITKVADASVAIYTVAASPNGEKLAIGSLLGVTPDFYVMNADGSGLTRLTYKGGKDISLRGEPVFSPDGKKMALVINGGEGQDIYVIDVDGSGLTRLTNMKGSAENPVWSRDGTKISFRNRRILGEDGPVIDHTYKMRSDGTEIKKAPNSWASWGNTNGLAWAPACKKMAYLSGPEGHDLYVRDADGQDTKIRDAHLTPNAQVSDPLVFSPDCKRIAFQSQPPGIPGEPGGYYDIYVIDADGTNLTRLTNHVRRDSFRRDSLVGWIVN